MGGRLWVESEPGKGQHLSLHGPADTGVGVAHPATASGHLAGLPVLVVDDNATNCRILEETLRSWNMRPRCVDGGEPALAELDAGRGGRGVLSARPPGRDDARDGRSRTRRSHPAERRPCRGHRPDAYLRRQQGGRPSLPRPGTGRLSGQADQTVGTAQHHPDGARPSTLGSRLQGGGEVFWPTAARQQPQAAARAACRGQRRQPAPRRAHPGESRDTRSSWPTTAARP